MRVIGDILSTAQEYVQDEEGPSVTYMIRKANMPHSRISSLLKVLVSQGLLEQVRSRGSSKYRISESGREFLQAYRAFTDFADSYGLRI